MHAGRVSRSGEHGIDLEDMFGVGDFDLFIGPDCVDPFARRVLRVSMGNAFKLHFFSVKDPLEGILQFRDAGIQSIATCFAKTARVSRI